MEKQINFADIEYGNRRRKTKREEFLEKMESVIPWGKWVEIIEPYYPDGKRGRRPQSIEKMLRMYLLQNWFSLSDEGIEDAIYDSYAMKQFMGVNFGANEQVPDATTLCKFRQLLNAHGIPERLFAEVQDILSSEGKMVHGGSIVDATIIEAPSSRKNAESKTDPEMHSVKKGNKWYFGMRAHIGVDPLYGFVHTVISTAANEPEVKTAPQLLRPDDEVVGKRFFARQNVFPLQIAVHHGNHRFFSAHLPHNRRYELNSKRFAGVFPPVTGNQFIAPVFTAPCRNRSQNTVQRYAVFQFLHFFIVLYLKRMFREVVDHFHCYPSYLFPFCIRRRILLLQSFCFSHAPLQIKNTVSLNRSVFPFKWEIADEC